MNDQQLAYWQTYIDDLKAELGLGHWDIELKPEPADLPDAKAQMTSVAGRFVGTIQLCWNFGTRSPEDQRQALIHELLHFHMEQMWTYLQEVLPDSNYKAFAHMAEYSVDSIAVAIAPNYALPKPPTEKKARKR